jgi:autotransporter-associated beta strand protein
MSSKFPWINNVLKSWTRSKSDKATRRPFRKFKARLWVEQLEVREVMTGAISLSGGALALLDSGTPTITVDLASNNYTVTDNNGLSGTMKGWTISGNTATEMDGLAGSITQLNFTTTNGVFGNSTTGIAAAPTAVVTINDATATIGGTAVTIDNLAAPNSTTLNIPSGDTLTVNSMISTNFAGNLTGAGNLAVTGTSTSIFTLSGSNSITGTTTVSSGTLEAATPSSLWSCR